MLLKQVFDIKTSIEKEEVIVNTVIDNNDKTKKNELIIGGTMKEEKFDWCEYYKLADSYQLKKMKLN